MHVFVFLGGAGYIWYIATIFWKGDNFCDFPFAFGFLKKKSTLKGKNLLPVGAYSSLLE